jgi:hypothetical protein
MTDRQEFGICRGLQPSAAIAGMIMIPKMETTEEGNLNRKHVTIASPDELLKKMETAPLRKRGRVLVGSSWTREPPTPPSARGMQK